MYTRLIILTVALILHPSFSHGKYSAFTQDTQTKEIQALIERLNKSRSTYARMAAANRLGVLKAHEAIPALLDALDDRDMEVQISSIFALGEIGDEHAIPKLLEIISNDNWSYRWALVRTLSKIGDERALPSLIDVLREECNDIFRLKEEVKMKSYLTADNFAELQIAIAIREFGEPSVPYLKTIIDDKNESARFRYQAATTLAYLGDRSAVPVLIDALKSDEDDSFRAIVAQYLGDLGDERAIPPLIDALEGPNAVRLGAYFALKRLGVKVEKNGYDFKIIEK